VAFELAHALEQRGYEYALGGAIALGYWVEPRGTIDVDVTLYVPSGEAEELFKLLQAIGCSVPLPQSRELLKEHGFCRVEYQSLRVDVFVPTIPFYELARSRRRQVPLLDGKVMVWDAETLAVFKLMFFREKDLLDLKQILKHQKTLDRQWVRHQVQEIYGPRDTRLIRWDEICNEVST
jgi:hypothetical protein